MATAPNTSAQTETSGPATADAVPSGLTDSRQRRAPRSEPHSLVAVVVPAGSDGCAEVEAEVIDLAKGGVKLVVTGDLALGQSITIRLLDENQQVVLNIRGTVCWSRPISSGQWRVGCRFDVELPVEQIGTLASGGYLERREHARYPLALTAMAQWELDNEPFPVELEDVSAGGFCVFGAEGNEHGQHLRLILGTETDEPTVIIATIRWQVKVENGYLIGCEFLDAQGYPEITRLADASPERSPLAVPKLAPEPSMALATARATRRGGGDDGPTATATIGIAYRRLAVAGLGIVVAFAALWVAASGPPNYLLACLAIGVAAVSSWQFFAATSTRREGS